ERDVTATDDCNTLGQLLEVKRFIRGDAQIQALDFALARGITAGGNQDGFGGYVTAGALEMNRVRVLEGGAILEDRRARIVEDAAVDVGNARDILVLGGDQGGPIEMRFVDGPAEAARIFEFFGKGAGVDEQF